MSWSSPSDSPPADRSTMPPDRPTQQSPCPSGTSAKRAWSWLLDTARLHETIGCSIVDTAHVLVVDALAKGDLALAREAAETACKAAPYDDICRLDLVKVAAGEGHREVTDQMLTDEIFNRTDDYLPPIDLSERTAEVVMNNDWGSKRRHARHDP